MNEEELKQIDGIRDQVDEVEHEKIPQAGHAGRLRKRYPKAYIEAQADRLNRWIDGRKAAWTAGEIVVVWQREYLLHTGLTYETMAKWSELNLNYKKAIDRLRLLQELALCKEGVRKGSNQPFVIFALKNCCGWRDGREVAQPKVAGKSYTDDTPEG